METKGRAPWGRPRLEPQRGAVMVETALVISLFLLLVFAIIEFALAMFKYASVVEATRAGARWAIVNNPVCGADLFGQTSSTSDDCAQTFVAGCATGSGQFTVECNAGGNVDCSGLLAIMNGIGGVFGNPIVANNVDVTYECSGAGFVENPRPPPRTTVRLNRAGKVQAQKLLYRFFVPGFLGIPATVPLPEVDATRLGEDFDSSLPAA